MLLTLDIGNTEVTVGWFEGETLTGRWRLTTNPDRTPDEWAGTLVAFLLQAGRSPNEARGAVYASVAPAVIDLRSASPVNIASARTAAPALVPPTVTPAR